MISIFGLFKAEKRPGKIQSVVQEFLNVYDEFGRNSIIPSLSKKMLKRAEI